MSIQTATIKTRDNVLSIPKKIWRRIAAPSFNVVLMGDTLILRPDIDEDDWPLDSRTKASLKRAFKDEKEGRVYDLKSFKDLK